MTGSSGPTDARNSVMLDLSVQLVGQEIKLMIPSTLKLDGDQLEASGAVVLSHKQLGLKPFSALLGSLRVAEQMKTEGHPKADPMGSRGAQPRASRRMSAYGITRVCAAHRTART